VVEESPLGRFLIWETSEKLIPASPPTQTQPPYKYILDGYQRWTAILYSFSSIRRALTDYQSLRQNTPQVFFDLDRSEFTFSEEDNLPLVTIFGQDNQMSEWFENRGKTPEWVRRKNTALQLQTILSRVLLPFNVISDASFEEVIDVHRRITDPHYVPLDSGALRGRAFL
jgi:hypothetical protein